MTREYPAKIIRVVDGDTVDAEIDLGFDITLRKRVRLYGIDTPESRTSDPVEKRFGLLATHELNTRLQDTDYYVSLKTFGEDKFGRVLGELWQLNENLNQWLVDEHHAVAYTGEINRNDLRTQHHQNRIALMSSTNRSP